MLEVAVVMNKGEGGEEDDGGRREDGGSGGGGGDRSSNGHRWPRHETMALLKIRSDMDGVFKESSLKGPLWEEVSRKMAGLGYQRNAKKCKEKFENIYKYHKRTKDGRAMKKDGKNYRFSDQLDALAPHQYHHHNLQLQQQEQHQQVLSPEKEVLHHEVVPQLLSMTTTSMAANPTMDMSTHQFNPPSLTKDFTTSTTSSSYSSGEESEGTRRMKRKMESFFESLMKDVMEKQENLQKRFLEAMEKRERERMMREESWKMQEIARMNREHEILAQERAMAAARDAAVIAFLNKMTEQSNQTGTTTATATTTTHQLRENLSPLMEKTTELDNKNQLSDINGDHNQCLALAPMVTMGVPNSRWPKSEVEALIRLRTELDRKYAENLHKGPLWEEVSAGMKRIGHDRNAKKCKEKWENINKYFKKVRESNKRRPEDSKTCPYYDQLDALYKEKMVMRVNNSTSGSGGNKGSEEIAMQVVMNQQPQQQQQSTGLLKDSSVLRNKGYGENDDDIDDIDDIDEDDDDEDDDGDEDEASGYEIAVNNNNINASSMPIVES